MLELKVKIINQLGLHARAAARLVRLASNFKSNITIKRTDNSINANAKSILSVLNLAASHGTELEFEFSGVDEQDAKPAIEKLFADGFGELQD